MTTQKDMRNRTIGFECDQCGEVHETDMTDFHDALDDFKDAGGVARLDCGEWLHFCGDCK